MTFDLNLGPYVLAIYLEKVLKFQNFIASITDDMNSWSVPGVKNDPVGPSSVKCQAGKLVSNHFLDSQPVDTGDPWGPAWCVHIFSVTTRAKEFLTRWSFSMFVSVVRSALQ